MEARVTLKGLDPVRKSDSISSSSFHQTWSEFCMCVKVKGFKDDIPFS